MIPVYKPYFTKESLKYAHDAIDSTWVSSHGKYLNLLEEKLKEIITSNYVILTNNGTAATHLVACALRYKHPEIQNLVVPSNVYVAAWNMFQVNPVFTLFPVDANLQTWNFDMSGEVNTDTAILVVHNLGNIINVPDLIKNYPYVQIIEDNCEGFLGEYDHMPSGSRSLAYSLSFFGNKTLTSGEGGAFCTDDAEIYEEMNRIRAQGITSEKFIFDGLGFNYRMTNVQAALLYGQLKIKDEIIERKSDIFYHYKVKLHHPLIHFQEQELNTKNANWMFGIRIDLPVDKINQLKLHLQYNDIETRPMFPPMNYHRHYHEFVNFPISKQLYETCIILPSYPELTNTEINYICKTILNFLK
jgi:perosamine synthetase